MSEVIDYSWARPSPALIRDHGYVGVMRYLSGGTGKDLSPGERDGLFAYGIEIGLVWETTANRMNLGYAAGAGDAQRANQQADSLGFPDRPIYFANDQNACTDTHVDYMRGARDNSYRPVAPYGNTQLIDRCANELGCRWGWKVSTWGPATGNTTLAQEANWPPTISGTDRNSVHRDDWGQWHGQSVTPPPPLKPNPGVKGMICINKQDGAFYLVGPGHAHHISSEEEWKRLQFVGVPLVYFDNGLQIVAWGKTFGVDGWDQSATWEKTY